MLTRWMASKWVGGREWRLWRSDGGGGHWGGRGGGWGEKNRRNHVGSMLSYCTGESFLGMFYCAVMCFQCSSSYIFFYYSFIVIYQTFYFLCIFKMIHLEFFFFFKKKIHCIFFSFTLLYGIIRHYRFYKIISNKGVMINTYHQRD